MIFVDTSAWFASVVPSDTDHKTASTWVAQNTQPLLTTDYVVDETLTLLRSRGEVRSFRLVAESGKSNFRLVTDHHAKKREMEQRKPVNRGEVIASLVSSVATNTNLASSRR